MDSRPWRSVLYIPASNGRAIEKARGLAVDAIIFDLEDAVSPDAKVAAREALPEMLAGEFGGRARLVRINGADTEWGADDLALVAGLHVEGILLPKVNTAADIAATAGALAHGDSDMAIWAMMETPLGILNAASIAQAPRMGGFVMGTNDLAKDLGSNGRAAMTTSLQLCLLAARGAGIVCVDGVYNAFRDVDGLREECIEGRNLGMDGKTLIHPAQIEVANEVFAPSEDDLELARAQIAAYRAARDEGKGVAVLDGKIVENLHVATAEALLARAEAIRKLTAVA